MEFGVKGRFKGAYKRVIAQENDSTILYLEKRMDSCEIFNSLYAYAFALLHEQIDMQPPIHNPPHPSSLKMQNEQLVNLPSFSTWYRICRQSRPNLGQYS